MVGSGILFFIALVLYLIMYSLSGNYVFIGTILPAFMWITVALGAVFAIFVIIAVIKAIFK